MSVADRKKKSRSDHFTGTSVGPADRAFMMAPHRDAVVVVLLLAFVVGAWTDPVIPSTRGVIPSDFP